MINNYSHIDNTADLLTLGTGKTNRNMLSADQNPQIIEEYIQAEVGKGNILGPFTEQVALTDLELSPRNTSLENGQTYPSQRVQA